MEIDLPAAPSLRGPGKKTEGFYNPSQRINRDLTLLFLRHSKPMRFLDAFGGSGIRGLRVRAETGIETTIAELNPVSAEIARKNALKNCTDVEIFNENFERTLERHLFDFIDVDPYGSVVPFIDKALTSVRNHGYVGITATDLSALTGSVPAKTYRKYAAHIKNDVFRHEMGIRLLIAYTARRGAAFDLGVVPLLSFWHSHFYRLVVRVDRGASYADRSAAKIGLVDKHADLWSEFESSQEGPVWRYEIGDGDTLKGMLSSAYEGVESRSLDLAERILGESTSLLFLELTSIARNVHSDMPALAKVRSLLDELGQAAHRTHFSPTGLKVSGSLEECYEAVKGLLKRQSTHSINKEAKFRA